MDHREKDEKNICCALWGKPDRSPQYEPEIHRFRNGRGDAKIDSYKVFPGIELNIYSVHMDGFFFGGEEEGNFMEIHHCREGRMEQGREHLYHAGRPVRYGKKAAFQWIQLPSLPLPRHFHMH